jgi:hypothetical protein
VSEWFIVPALEVGVRKHHGFKSRPFRGTDLFMIIGIDDSGDFESTEVGLYAAVLIRPKKQAKIEKIFLDWEKLFLTPQKKGKK